MKGIIAALKRFRGFDITLFVLTVGLALFGVVMVFSASYYSSQNSGGTGVYFLEKQIQGIGIGLFFLISLSYLPYQFFSRKSVVYGMLGIAVVCLIIVLLTPEDTNGAKRWLNLGFVSFQPSEVGRFAMLCFCAMWFARYEKAMRSKRFSVFFRALLPALGVAGLVCGLILAGSNLSMTACTGMLFLCLLLYVGVNMRIMGLFYASAGLAGVLATVTKAYRMRRLMIFTNPWRDPQGDGHQLVQSLYALGAGGLFGVGLGNSRQKYLYLPYAESDFIMAIIGEELGLVGIALVLAAFGVLIWRGFVIAAHAKDTHGMLLAAGIISIVAIQMLVHIAVVASVMPPTGVPLPFVSAGNTSLIMFMAEMGVLLNISRQSRAG